MATFTVRRENTNSKLTHTILQNILVVGVGRVLKKAGETVTDKKDAAESLVLTLALSPIEAQTMALAQAEAQGEISVVVRPHGDDDVREVPISTPGNLLGFAPAEQVPQQQRAGQTSKPMKRTK